MQRAPAPTSTTGQRRPPNVLVLLPIAFFGALIVAIGFFFVLPRLRNPSPTVVTSAQATAIATAQPSDVAIAPSVDTAPSASSTAAPLASAETSSAPVAGAAPKESDPNACMQSLFAPDTFVADQAPDLTFICNETDPRRAGPQIRVAVVRAGERRGPTEGMREWARLGWYEMAAFAVMRGRCCSSELPPLTLPYAVGSCPSMDDALKAMSAAAIAGPPDKVNAALDGYTEAVRCLVRSGASNAFGGYPKPQGGEEAAFRKTLERLANKSSPLSTEGRY